MRLNTRMSDKAPRRGHAKQLHGKRQVVSHLEIGLRARRHQSPTARHMKVSPSKKKGSRVFVDLL